MIQITERDKEFLLKLNETGACSSEVLRRFYPKRYAKDRIEKMGIEKIVNRKYNLIMLGLEGKNYLESIGVIPKMIDTLPTSSQRRLSRALDLKFLLPNFKIVTSGEYKKEKNLNRGMQFVAAGTTKAGSTYLIYDVPKALSIETKTQILRELKNKKDVINNAIIFTRNKNFVQVLSENNVYISELILLPPNEFSINLVNEMGKGDFDRKVIGAAFPELMENKMFGEKQTKYILGNNSYINMVLNNISACDMLRSMDIHAIQNNTSSAHIYNIVCLDEQKAFMQYTIDQLNLKKINVKLKGIAPGQTSFY